MRARIGQPLCGHKMKIAGILDTQTNFQEAL